MHRIIIDTDIGTNADDAVALLLAARSPEISLEGVTTVYGQVDVRAKIARKILKLAGSNVQIYLGIERPLLRNRKVYWTGIEEADDIGDEAPTNQHAVDFIIDTILHNPGEITLVTIGPLTNIAAAIIREPRIIDNIKEIVMMAGVTRLGKNGLYIECIEHNVKCDPEAAAVVFGSGVSILMVGYDVTRQVQVTRDEVTEIRQDGNELTCLMSDMLFQHMDFMNRNFSYLNDPLTIGALIDRSLVQTKRMKVKVQYDHSNHSGQTIAELNTNGNVEVCLDVDVERFLEMLVNRVFLKNDNN